MEYMYAALLLHKLGKEVSESAIKSVVAATGTSVDDSKVKSLVASLKDVNIDTELANASLVSAAPAAQAAVAKEEAPKKEEKHAAAAEGLSALFG
ncbi:50S ribosomal protein P1 [Candidatus Pacearchaeota archaeon CG10_big_fil_rev_8_21_14_0_10_32_42]|nr:MAG: 50S ribosomal protein P1 [Candidatus Pacearchaeota archaeon CG10_big_fil_rev_8_21_14_0_10_32_42]